MANEQQQQVLFDPNVPIRVRLKFDKPYSFDGKYGPRAKWTVEDMDDGQAEKAWFMDQAVADQMVAASLGKGKVLEVTFVERTGEKGLLIKDAGGKIVVDARKKDGEASPAPVKKAAKPPEKAAPDPPEEEAIPPQDVPPPVEEDSGKAAESPAEEQADIRQHVAWLLAIAKEVKTRWSGLHEYRPEMYTSALTGVYIQMGRITAGAVQPQAIKAYVGRYKAIAEEILSQWPGLDEKDPELFQKGVATIFIAMCK